MQIPQKDLEAIRAQADIVDIIGRYLPLQPSGKEYVGVCPFHDDHSPSMRVSPSKQIFKCFSCGAGGNVFTFVSRIENISFVQSVLQVASFIQYPISAGWKQEAITLDPHQPLYDTLQRYIDYCAYERTSVDGEEASAYLKSRKFDEETLKKFEIGYAPSSEIVRKYLQSVRLNPIRLQKTGLIHDEEALDPIFCDRIIIPIHDPKGNPVGLSARILPGSNARAKYINTTTTEIYEKSKLLFNYHRARKTARKAGRIIICEGAMDVLGLEKAGIHEGVAALGTAFGPDQFSLIARLQVPIIVFYDQDAAGRKAAYHFGLEAMKRNLPFSIVSNHSGKDPDEIFVTSGAETLQKVLARTISFAEFSLDYLQSVYNLENYEDREKYAQQMNSIISATASPALAAMLYEKLKDLCGYDYASLKREVQRPSRSKNRKDKKNPVAHPTPLMDPGRLRSEKRILMCMLASMECIQEFRDEIGFFEDENCQKLFLYLYHAMHEDIRSTSALFDEIEEEEVRNLLAEIIAISQSEETYSYDLFREAMDTIKRKTLETQIARISEQIAREADAMTKIELAQKKARLIEEKKNYVNRQ